jgi:acyl transferase domain-containing protein
LRQLTEPEIGTPDVAIIGTAGRFPGPRDVEELWQSLVAGREATVELTEQALLPNGAQPADYVRPGRLLADVDMLDAPFSGLTPEYARVLDPQQRLFLEYSWDALEDAGHDPRRFDGLIGVFAGSCSSSLVAVCAAATSLIHDECDLAIAGGSSVSVPQGAGVVVLRLLADALADGDHVRAVVRGWAVDRDGGGTNAHVVLEQAAAPVQRPEPVRTRHLLVWSARSESALADLTDSVRGYLMAGHGDDLGDVAFTLQTGRAAFEHRRCVVTGSLEDAATALADPALGGVLASVQPATERAVGLLIAGVGEQYPGIAGRLYATEPAFRDRVEAGRAALWSRTGRDPLSAFVGERPNPGSGDALGFRALIGRTQAGQDAQAADLARTEILQPALFTVWYALAETLREWGIRPAVMLGYSLGEYVAACLSGVLSFDDALGLVTHRAELISRVPPGAMVAVALGEVPTRAAIDEAGLPIDIAGVNAPRITVVAGPVDAVARFRGLLSARKVASRPLATSHGFHSRLLDGAAADLTAWVRGHVTLHVPRIPYLSNITGREVTAQEVTDPAYWARHMCATVRFSDAVTTMLQRDDLALLEIGPGPSLGTMVRANPACDRVRWGSIIATLPSATDPRPADAVLAEAIGRLWLAGVPFDFTAYHSGHGSRRVPLPRRPYRRERHRLAAPRQADGRAAAARRPLVFERMPIRNGQGRDT